MLDKIRNYAQECYNNANCEYDGTNYFTHIQMVYDVVETYRDVFKSDIDFRNTLGASLTHDLLEDTKESYNNIATVCGIDIANITLAVTDVPANNRLMKHLLTMHKTVKDYRAIVLKMCDIYANASYSKQQINKTSNKSMYHKYVVEYAYRKPIFQLSLKWYDGYLNHYALNELWNELDKIHGYE